MRTGYTQIDEWPVRPYSKRELAMAYAPEISPVSALNRLAEWMRYNDRLTRELGDTGYRPRQRVFTSLQVELINTFNLINMILILEDFWQKTFSGQMFLQSFFCCLFI